MNANLLFDFSVDKQNNTISVKREFRGSLEAVWEAWTNPAILDLWWAPRPYRTKTKSMDFSVGGCWLYAMYSPENVAHWCRADYKSIEHKKHFSGLDAFCDENGVVNKDFPRSLWSNEFNKTGETTTVNISVKYEKLADLEKIIELGFQEGFTMALGNLDEYLEQQHKIQTSYKH
jgi:uncharacterized protein YndB with AHSA1/START domain